MIGKRVNLSRPQWRHYNSGQARQGRPGCCWAHWEKGIYFRDRIEIRSCLASEATFDVFKIQTMMLLSFANELNYFQRSKKAKKDLFLRKFGHVRENKLPQYVSVGESLCQILGAIYRSQRDGGSIYLSR